MAFGSMAPGLPQMAVPQMQQPNIQDQVMKILMAALGGNKQGGTGGAPSGVPALLGPSGGVANMMGGGMGNGLLSKLFPQSPATPGAIGAPAGPIDPNTGLPVTPDVLAGAADMGGMGPAPTALTGLW